MTAVFTVYEHQTIQVGDYCTGVTFEQRHYKALCGLAERSSRSFFTVLSNGIRFAQYVGILQAGDLTIEVLPKADRQRLPERRTWQRLLIDLLHTCRLLPLHRLPVSGQQVQQHTLLDLYIDIFLEEVGALLRQGLSRSYRRQQGREQVLKGRLLLVRQLREQGRPTQFHIEQTTYDYEHLFNSLLWQALKMLAALPLPAARRQRVQQLQGRFPAHLSAPDLLPNWERLRFNRRTERYRPALRIAWLLLQQYHPNLRAGQFPAFSLLFDMNLLFEEFICRQLRQGLPEGVSLRRQLQQPFWNRRQIRPDLLLTDGRRRIILDTKWKILTRPQPSIDDLRQLFIYQQYFRAQEGILLYPSVSGLPDTPPQAFHPLPAVKKTFHCRLIFLDLLDGNQRLNINLGKEWFAKLIDRNWA